MQEKGTLFSIDKGQAASLGAKLVMSGKRAEPGHEVIPELAASGSCDGVKFVGAFIWGGGTLGNLWNKQLETYQFVLDNIDKVMP